MWCLIPIPRTRPTPSRNHLARLLTPITLYLYLLKNSRQKYLFDGFYPTSTAADAFHDVFRRLGCYCRNNLRKRRFLRVDLDGATGGDVREGEFDDGLLVGNFARMPPALESFEHISRFWEEEGNSSVK